MFDGTAVATYVFSCVGFTVLIVWPVGGPTSWLRDRLLRPALPSAARVVLDCYICCGTWVGLIAAPFWWWAGYRWAGIAWPMLPAVFWLFLDRAGAPLEGGASAPSED